MSCGVSPASAAAASGTRCARHDRLLDPRKPADARTRATVLEATLVVERLKASLEPLQKRAAEVYHDEEVARWMPHYQSLKDQRDALAERLREVYLPFTEAVVPLLREIEQLDISIRQLNFSAPHDGAQHLATTEEFARGRFTGLSVVVDMKLPAWSASAMASLWPPNRSVDAAMITPMPSTDPRAYSADWWQVQRGAG